MQNDQLFADFSDEYLSNPIKFATWILSLYKQGHIHGHIAVEPFAVELVSKFLNHSLPLTGTDKEEFIDKFNNYTKDGNRYSFDLESLLSKSSMTCCALRDKLIEQIRVIRKGAEAYLSAEKALNPNELSDLFYHLHHNMGSSYVYNRLVGISNNLAFLNEHGIVTKDDLENYLLNYRNKEKEFGMNPLDKFKKDKASTK